MYKNIIIISSDYTGHGHKSITEALKEQLANYPQVNIHVIDGYSLGGSLGLKIGKMYGAITRASKDLWKFIWDITLKKPSLISEVTESTIRNRLIRTIDTIKPDAIITTHANYVSSVISILNEHSINIPIYTIVADPVTISPLWADARANYTICPTIEAKEACMEFGVPESRIKVFGFPVRQRFCKHIKENDKIDYYNPAKPLRCLIMSGGEGSGNMSRIAKILLKNFNCEVKIICGRNKLLRKRLQHSLLEKSNDRIEILGFVNDMHSLMLESDVLFCRASPNVMMEAVMCNLPLVITGALPGQEQGNPGYAEKYKLGVVCPEIKELKNVVSELLENNSLKLKNIKKSQVEYRDPHIAKNIIDFIQNN